MLQQIGVTVPPGTSMQLKNVAAVMVTAQLPAFAQPGQTIDVDRLVARQRQEPARRHPDRDAAEGRRRPGLRDRAGQPGGRRRRRVGGRLEGADQPPERSGRIPDGATVERAVATPMNQGDSIQLDLNSSDFATAREVVRAINDRMGSGIADALDGRVIRVRMPAIARRARRLHGRDREPRRRAVQRRRPRS